MASPPLEHRFFDVVIVGGGINGAGLARDLALRSAQASSPLSVLLLEKNFWGHGTSGRNSHLIHGGLRYLKYFDFRLVHEALRERSRLLALSPHCVRPLRFVLPVNSFFEQCFYASGIALYDLLSLGHRIGSSRYFSKQLSYWDAASDSAVLVIDNVREAQAHGVLCQPRTTVTHLAADHVVLASGETIRAGVVVDARGPWMQTPGMRLVRGSHLVLPRLYPEDHAIAHFHHDGRIIFFIPWGDLAPVTLIGTTDVDHAASPDDVAISPAEESYLLSIARQLFPHRTIPEPVGRFSSLRPLVQAPGQSASSTSREHRIEFDAQGVIRILGGKYTTYRAMAEESADLALSRVRPALVGTYPTRHAPFRIDTARPRDVAGRLAWARREEGCASVDEFLTCSTNWAWQKVWSPQELANIAEAFRA